MKKVIKSELLNQKEIEKILKKRSLIDITGISISSLTTISGIIGTTESEYSELFFILTILSGVVGGIMAVDHLNCENKLTKLWFDEYDALENKRILK